MRLSPQQAGTWRPSQRRWPRRSPRAARRNDFAGWQRDGSCRQGGDRDHWRWLGHSRAKGARGPPPRLGFGRRLNLPRGHANWMEPPGTRRQRRLSRRLHDRPIIYGRSVDECMKGWTAALPVAGRGHGAPASAASPRPKGIEIPPRPDCFRLQTHKSRRYSPHRHQRHAAWLRIGSVGIGRAQ